MSSNRGIRGVRVVGPGSRARQRPGEETTERDVANGSAAAAHTSGPETLTEEAPTAEAAAAEAVAEGGALDHEAALDAIAGVTDHKVPLRERRWPLRASTAVAVLGVAGTVGFGVAWHTLNGQQNNINAAKKQAQNYIIALTNFDPKGLDNEINKIESYTTGNFKTSIAQFFSNDTRKTLLSRNAASRGQIRAIYPQSNSGGHVTFFAVVDDTIANNQLSAPASDEIDMTVDMVNTSQGWRVSNNTFLQSPLFSPTQSGNGSTPSTTTPKP